MEVDVPEGLAALDVDVAAEADDGCFAGGEFVDDGFGVAHVSAVVIAGEGEDGEVGCEEDGCGGGEGIEVVEEPFLLGLAECAVVVVERDHFPAAVAVGGV